MTSRALESTLPPVTSAGSEARTIWKSDPTRVQSQPATTESPASAATRASSAEFIVNELKRHKTATILGAILILIGAAAAVFGIRSYLHAGNTEVAVESIAVIPFVNQNKDPECRVDLRWPDREHHQQPHTSAEPESDRSQLRVSLQGQGNGSDGGW